ncbi:UDP-glucuronosyltransferase, partial [Mycobacterium sp. ITM-2017-0098]
MPMVNVGQGLQALGHDITVLTGADFTDAVESAGLRMASLPDSVRIEPPNSVNALLRRLPTQVRRFWLGRAELDSVFAKPLAVEAKTLMDTLRHHPVDAIVADVTFTGVVP